MYECKIIHTNANGCERSQLSLDTRTLPVGLQILNSSYAGQYRPMVLAGAVTASVPILIVYVIFQRQIIKGVTLTGMGGR